MLVAVIAVACGNGYDNGFRLHEGFQSTNYWNVPRCILVNLCGKGIFCNNRRHWSSFQIADCKARIPHFGYDRGHVFFHDALLWIFHRSLKIRCTQADFLFYRPSKAFRRLSHCPLLRYASWYILDGT